MRTASTLLCFMFGGLALAIVGCVAWLYIDGSGLPDIRSMRGLVEPSTPAPNIECLAGHPVVVAYGSLGTNARYALSAAETPENSPGVIAAIIGNRRAASSAVLLSRRIFCTDERPLEHSFDEIRTAIQLERRYSKRELFTMLANSAYFGEGVVGIEAAALHYFHKQSNELSVPEAALLAGLASHPSYYSPKAHPDRAFIRRNQVIEKMAQNGFISATEASGAKTAPILIAGG